MDNIKISVVTVCYNAIETIEDTIRSIVEQTYEYIEYIIVDGGSIDGTCDIIKKYADCLTYWISEPDSGIYDAMNKGIAVATGDYIIFMNSGDKFHNSTVIADTIPYIKDNTVAVYGSIMYIYPNGESIVVKPSDISLYKQLMPICHQAIFIKTDIHKQHPYDLSFKICADYNLLYCLIDNYGDSFINMPLIVCDYDGNGISLKNHVLAHRENYRVIGIKSHSGRFFKRELSLCVWRVKEFIFSMLPQNISTRIRIWKKNRVNTE